jgi:hypothetical protein
MTSPARSGRPPGASSAAHSGVAVTIPARISTMYACAGLSGTPLRACAAAGLTSRASGIVPNRAAAAQTPAGTPYVPTEATPMLNSWTALPNEIATGTSSARAPGIGPRPGASTKKSSRTAFAPGGTTSM